MAVKDAPDNCGGMPVITMPDSRFAENDALYHLSKGHGGVMCEGCHGSTLETDDNGSIFLPRGTPVRCDICHENEL